VLTPPTDLDPVPPEQRTWRNWDFITYWCSDQFTIATWSFGAILVGQGFTFREIIPITFCGFLLTGIVVALCGHIATNYHIGFPLSTRMSWGMRGGAFPVLIRAFMALMWLAILNLVG
jgi:NCS1 family nucleobase:cation symporter-1